MILSLIARKSDKLAGLIIAELILEIVAFIALFISLY